MITRRGLFQRAAAAFAGCVLAKMPLAGAFVEPLPRGPIVWTDAAGDGDWGNAKNWSSGRVPGTGDDVIVRHGHIRRGLSQPGTALSSLTIEGGSIGTEGDYFRVDVDRFHVRDGGEVRLDAGSHVSSVCVYDPDTVARGLFMSNSARSLG